MSFPLTALRGRPQALYTLDDAAPFQDYSGYGRTGTTVSGTPGTSVSLARGAVYSQVFDRNVVGKFASPIFNQGKESDPFTLETWLYPVQKSAGQTAQAYRENLAVTPAPTVYADIADQFAWKNTRWFGGGTGAGTYTIVTGTTAPGGNSYARKTWTVAPPSNGDTGFEHGSAGTQAFNVVPGETYTFSSYLRPSSAGKTARISVYQYIDTGTAFSTPRVNGSNVVMGAGGWSRISYVYTVPAGVTQINLASDIVAGGTLWAAGDTLEGTGLLIEKTGTVNTFFDGNSPGAEWAGTANASVSRTRKDVAFWNSLFNPNFEGTYITSGNGTVAPNWGRRSPTIGFAGPVTSPWGNGTAQQFGATNAGEDVGITIGANNQRVNCKPGDTLTFLVRHSGPSDRINIGIEFFSGAGTFITGIYQKISVVGRDSNGWVRHQVVVPSNATTITHANAMFYTSTLAQAGDTHIVDQALLTNGAYSGTFFDGSTPGAVWSGTANASTSNMLISNSEQQVLSHSGAYDGLSVNGTKVSFTTKYTDTTEAKATYDLQQIKRVHLVGVHTADKNSLYVNGELAEEVDITETQQLSTYVATSPDLYSGTSLSSQAVALNGVTIYDSALSPEAIATNYRSGLVEQDIAAQTDADQLSPTIENSNVFLDQTWATQEEWESGQFFNTAVANEQLVPQFSGDTSLPGSWYTAFDLEASNVTSIYGVNLNWDGEGAVVQASLDGTTWETVQRGINLSIIPSGFDPTDDVLQIRVTFAGGIVDDESYLDSLNVVGFITNTSLVQDGRTITYASAHPEREFSPLALHDDWGAFVSAGGSLTISADALDASPARTVELWIKRVGDNPTISATGTIYQNGAVSTATLVPGQWTLLHIVAAADITGTITINGPAQVGHIGIYDTALTAPDIAEVYNAYIGNNKQVVTDSTVLTIGQDANAAQIYAHDWTIQGAG